MKFSEQGLEKIENYSSVDLEIEGLEPEDFKDVVVLTLKEAKLVQGGIRLLALRSNIYLEGGLVKMLQELLDNVDKQIEQAEMSK